MMGTNFSLHAVGVHLLRLHLKILSVIRLAIRHWIAADLAFTSERAVLYVAPLERSIVKSDGSDYGLTKSTQINLELPKAKL